MKRENIALFFESFNSWKLNPRFIWAFVAEKLIIRTFLRVNLDSLQNLTMRPGYTCLFACYGSAESVHFCSLHSRWNWLASSLGSTVGNTRADCRGHWKNPRWFDPVVAWICRSRLWCRTRRTWCLGTWVHRPQIVSECLSMHSPI